MNVTQNKDKDRQLQKEGYLQRVSAEQREYAEASVYDGIAENNVIITDFGGDNLLERILHKDGISEGKAWEFANTRKGYWRTTASPILHRSLDNKTIASLGYMTMTDYYLKVCEN